jgi:hypothetical protein
MSCRSFEDLVILHAYGELESQDAERVGTHLAACGECSKSFESFRAMAGMVSEMPDAPGHQLSNERLREAILRAGMQRHRSSPLSWLGVGAPLAAAAAVAAFVFWPSASEPTSPGSGEPPVVATGGPSAESPVTAPSSVGPAIDTAPDSVTAVEEPDQPVRRPSGRRARPSGSRFADAKAAPGVGRAAIASGGFGGPPGARSVSPDSAGVPLVMIAPNPSGSDGTSDATEMRSTDVASIGG